MRVSSKLCITVFAASCAALPTQATTSSASQPAIVVPAQLGPYPVSIYEHEVKTSRQDPLAPTPELRRLLITIYRPFLDTFTCPPEHQSQIPYIKPTVGDALLASLPIASSSSGTSSTNFSSILTPLKLVNCSLPISPSSESGPLVLFSPGYGGTQSGYASILQAAASSGYTVVAIDPTYEAAAVAFPDGYVAYPSAATNAYDNSTSGQDLLQAIRIADAVSVLDAIEEGIPGLKSFSRASRESKLGFDGKSSCPPLRALMYGHSFGGSTALNVAYTDDRVIVAANIDGPVYEPLTNNTLHKPAFLMQSAEQPPVADNWPDIYQSHLHGWKTWVRPNNTVHYSFTDLPLLADLLDLRGTFMPDELIGTVSSQRLQEIVWRYTTQFFDFAFKEKTSGLLEKSSTEFPDVAFIGHEEAKAE